MTEGRGERGRRERERERERESERWDGVRERERRRVEKGGRRTAFLLVGVTPCLESQRCESKRGVVRKTEKKRE